MSDRHPLHWILSRVEKPGRYVGGEWNEIKKSSSAVEVRIALAFPDAYEIGMSYLGQKILYSLLNQDESIQAERVFAPWPDFEQALRSAGLPLTSLESAIPLADFDILGFSLLYELNYTNILTILDLGGIPLLSSQRELRHPLVIAGGPAAFNPEPTADIFDIFLVGDGEESFLEIVGAYRDLKKNCVDRASILRGLAWISGVYVPSSYRTGTVSRFPLSVPEPFSGAPPGIRKRTLSEFGKSHFPTDIIVPNLRVVFDRVAMEAARGCPQNCRFCQATSIYFPHRVKDPDFLLKTVTASLLQTGYGDCSLSALSISDYPYLEETVRALMDELSPQKISLSLSSLRPAGLSKDLVENILRVRKTGFTLVPEAGTERLRNVINKKLKDRDIRDALTHAFSAGWQLVKFYFMAGLPTETEEDLRGIISLVRRSWESGRAILQGPPRIHVSLSSFIPKPHTPFQWAAMDDEKTLEDKKRYIRSELKGLRSVELKDHPVKASILEAVFSRGDRRLNRVLLAAWEKGARFDSWGDRFDFSRWEDAFEEEGVSYHDFLKAIKPEDPLPWDHIDSGIRKAHFLREWKAAMNGEASPSCAERMCVNCGGCDLQACETPGIRPKIVSPPYRRPWMGDPADELIRYRGIYEKKGKARYLSHIDLIQVLQRSFRRAGVASRQTQGYHPKPDFSYGPALPLGMEGLKEVLEFKSFHRIGEEEFLSRINLALPSGIRFRTLLCLSRSDNALSRSITDLVYSMDWDDKEMKRGEESLGYDGAQCPKSLTPGAVKEALEAYRGNHQDMTFHFTIEGRRLILRIPLSSQKIPRVQDIIKEAFGLEHPAFHLQRDEVVLN